MADLPARPDLDQLRHQARELLRAAQRGDPEATARIRAVTSKIILSSAQLANPYSRASASCAEDKMIRPLTARTRAVASMSPRWAARSSSLAWWRS